MKVALKSLKRIQVSLQWPICDFLEISIQKISKWVLADETPSEDEHARFVLQDYTQKKCKKNKEEKGFMKVLFSVA